MNATPKVQAIRKRSVLELSQLTKKVIANPQPERAKAVSSEW